MNKTDKIYQENSYLTTLNATVIDCTKKNNIYELILDKTIFYPHMAGGQPKDIGTINGVEILNVFERNNKIIHEAKEPIQGNVLLSIDFTVRYDYMQQHTGQHLLSYAFDKLYNGKTVGFHISKDYTTIDIDIKITDTMSNETENFANDIIYKNKKITFSTLNYNDAIKMNLRKEPPKLNNLRIVNIENIEATACGGTHVNATGEVGIIKIVKMEKYKSGTRIYFLCGKRALNDYNNKTKDLLEISTTLTCGTELIKDTINKLKAENKNYTKIISSLSNKLNLYKAKELKTKYVKKNDINFIFEYLENTNIKDLRFICSKIIEDENYVSVIVSEINNNCNIVIGQSNNMNYDLENVFEACKKLINAKGGGNNKLIQGTGDILNGREFLNTSKDLLLNN